MFLRRALFALLALSFFAALPLSATPLVVYDVAGTFQEGTLSGRFRVDPDTGDLKQVNLLADGYHFTSDFSIFLLDRELRTVFSAIIFDSHPNGGIVAELGFVLRVPSLFDYDGGPIESGVIYAHRDGFEGLYPNGLLEGTITRESSPVPPSPVPEPATIALLLTGTGGLAALRRRGEPFRR